MQDVLTQLVAVLKIVLVLSQNPVVLANPSLHQDLIAFQSQAASFADAAMAAQATSTPATGAASGSELTAVTSTPSNAGSSTNIPATLNSDVISLSAPAPRTISVSFNATGTDGFVTITNDSGAAVRIKSLDVTGGTLAGITIGQTYGVGIVYMRSFTDNVGKSFDRLSCNGLGSLGQAVEYGGPVDPCARKDLSGVVNELQPGEVMILRYTGNPSGVTHQVGSIVEVGNGNDVTF